MMDDILYFIVFGLFALVTCLIMPWVNHSRIARLRREMDRVVAELRALRGGTVVPDAPPVQASPVAMPVAVPRIEEPAPVPPQLQPALPATKYTPAPKHNFEFNLGAKLPVWIGAISLICAAFFLVKYSIEAGWMGPVTRVLIGGAFGLALTVAGQWTAAQKKIANHERIAQGLVGAGLVSLYVCLYAAVNLYALIPAFVGLCGMTAVTALAVILSLRQKGNGGQAIAAFGLIGGLLTPVLVGSDHPDTPALFGYLFVLFGFIATVLARRGWWVLAAMALLGVFAWVGFWFMFVFAPDDFLAATLFVMGICGVVLAGTARVVTALADKSENTKMPHVLNCAAVGGAAATILVLGIKAHLSLFDWSMLELLSVACIALTYFRPDIYRFVLWAKLIADMLLFSMWMGGQPLNNVIGIAGLLGAVYAILPFAIMHRVRDPRLWAGLQLASTVSVFIITYSGVSAHNLHLWGLISLALAAVSVALVRKMQAHYHADGKIREHLVALYALGATAFLSLGFVIELDWTRLPLAFAAQAAATVWLAGRTGIESLRRIALGVLIVFIGLNYEQAEPVCRVLFSEMGWRWHAPALNIYSYAMIAARLVIPAALLGWALIEHRKHEDADNDKLSHVLFGTILMLALVAGYQLGLHLFPDTNGFIKRGIATFLIAASGLGISLAAEAPRRAFVQAWGTALLYLAMARIALFDLLFANPFFDGNQHVGGLPVLNGVTLTYGTGVALTAWMIYGHHSNRFRPAYKAFGFAVLFAFVTLTVRQLFHGDVLAHVTTGSGEFYSYSIAWLVLALGELAYGIKTGSRTARQASLAFMLLTVGKVFLFDAAQLEGLYRIFSFLGLGLSLIGLSVFYTRFVLKQEQRPDKEEAGGPWWF